MNRILHGKNALIFGATGSIGISVAKEFSAEGARVYLSGRSKAKLDAAAHEVSANASIPQTTVVDVSDPAAVDVYIDDIVKEAGGIDIVFNAAGPLPALYGNGKLAVDSTFEEFSVALDQVVKPQYITARAAAKQMTKQHSGVVLFQTGSPARGHVSGGTAIGTAFGAIETLAENLAFEISPLGVRVVCLRTTANTDTVVIRQTAELVAGMQNTTKEQVLHVLANLNFLKTNMSVHDTAQALAFLASDRARMFTATVVNASAGAALD
jgi:NAD(P)-dependent dehydrogenase (short-subunit alcohol dehydrogenase family)